MKNKLKILPVKKPTTKKVNKIPYPLQKPNFLLIVCGPCKSGKGVYLMNLIENRNFGYRDYFDNIVYISPTLESDTTGQVLYKDEEIVKITKDLDHFNEILEIIANKQKDSGESMLLCIDDCLGLIGSNSSFFSNFCSKYRHYNMSVVVSTQNFRSLPLICRSNASGYIFYRTHNLKEKEKMNDELSGMYPDFMDLYDKATSKKYDFLYLDVEEQSAWRNYDEKIYQKE